MQREIERILRYENATAMTDFSSTEPFTPESLVVGGSNVKTKNRENEAGEITHEDVLEYYTSHQRNTTVRLKLLEWVKDRAKKAWARFGAETFDDVLQTYSIQDERIIKALSAIKIAMPHWRLYKELPHSFNDIPLNPLPFEKGADFHDIYVSYEFLMDTRVKDLFRRFTCDSIRMARDLYFEGFRIMMSIDIRRNVDDFLEEPKKHKAFYLMLTSGKWIADCCYMLGQFDEAVEWTTIVLSLLRQRFLYKNIGKEIIDGILVLYKDIPYKFKKYYVVWVETACLLTRVYVRMHLKDLALYYLEIAEGICNDFYRDSSAASSQDEFETLHDMIREENPLNSILPSIPGHMFNFSNETLPFYAEKFKFMEETDHVFVNTRVSWVSGKMGIYKSLLWEL